MKQEDGFDWEDVSKDIDTVVSGFLREQVIPEDSQFQESADHFEEEYNADVKELFFDEYANRVSRHMAGMHVEAFKQHDKAENEGYFLGARAFGELFSFFPAGQKPYRTSAAERDDVETPGEHAGMHEILALEWHDLIDNGYEEAKDKGALVDGYRGMNKDGTPRPTEEIFNDPGWEDKVKPAFEKVEAYLVPDDVAEERDLPSYAEEKKEFYKYDTAARESDPETIDEETKKQYMQNAIHHARQALRGLYGQFVDPDDTETWSKLDELYEIAVKTHNYHSKHTDHAATEHVQNRETMYKFHRTIMDKRIEDAIGDYS